MLPNIIIYSFERFHSFFKMDKRMAKNITPNPSRKSIRPTMKNYSNYPLPKPTLFVKI
jgi:hypothetical protein